MPSYTFDETSATEWMRIREVETERALVDCHGNFYELSYHTYGNGIWGIRPISSHLRIVPDFCSWRGMLILGGNQTSPIKFSPQDTHSLAGQPQSNLWFGKTDDLWSFGKPSGMGGPWYHTTLKPEEVSDPFLTLGFDKKVLHLKHNATSVVNVKIEVDIVGDGQWLVYETIRIPPGGYIHHVFPDGFSAHWVRLSADTACNATAYFIYN